MYSVQYMQYNIKEIMENDFEMKEILTKCHFLFWMLELLIELISTSFLFCIIFNWTEIKSSVFWLLTIFATIIRSKFYFICFLQSLKFFLGWNFLYHEFMHDLRTLLIYMNFAMAHASNVSSELYVKWKGKNFTFTIPQHDTINVTMTIWLKLFSF